MLASFIFLTMRIAIYPHKIPISITNKFKKFPARTRLQTEIPQDTNNL